MHSKGSFLFCASVILASISVGSLKGFAIGDGFRGEVITCTEEERQKLNKHIEEMNINSKGTPSGESLEGLKYGAPESFAVLASARRNYSRIKLERDSRYRFSLEPVGFWCDKGVPAHPIKGWGNGDFPLVTGWIRYLGNMMSYASEYDLMVLLGIVEGKNQWLFAFSDGVVKSRSTQDKVIGEFEAKETGELFAFANDTQMDYFYDNNVGYLTVTIEKIQREDRSQK